MPLTLQSEPRQTILTPCFAKGCFRLIGQHRPVGNPEFLSLSRLTMKLSSHRWWDSPPRDLADRGLTEYGRLQILPSIKSSTYIVLLSLTSHTSAILAGLTALLTAVIHTQNFFSDLQCVHL